MSSMDADPRDAQSFDPQTAVRNGPRASFWITRFDAFPGNQLGRQTIPVELLTRAIALVPLLSSFYM